MAVLTIGSLTREGAAALLAEARERTLLLVGSLTSADLRTQHDVLMSPILWDLGHIAHFEELWLTRNLSGPIEFSEMPGMYNPFEHPRRTRASLPLPALDEWTTMANDIRARVLAVMGQTDFDADSPLLRDGYVYRMVAQHEYQHNETILQTLQLKTGGRYQAPRSREVPSPTRPHEPGAMVRFPGGSVTIGTDDRTASYDNERPAHSVDLAEFWIDATPVTNGEYIAFHEDGGYERRELWSDAGWAWRTEAQLVAPQYWERAGGSWTSRVMDRQAPIDPARPVCHVCHYEADAFARWANKRLPTETEWEAAARFDPRTGSMRAHPWGDDDPSPELANLDQLAFDVAPVWSYPHNVSPIGCYGMIGDVWEWTASDLAGYPGFTPFPYAEYSQAFFGSEYKVLRGGSWATRPGAIRTTFRNWDYPIRRQIFSGFRCARSEG
ncbi:MAG TPA: ergothioneine biosynthesis protein EgtB [Gemmatimonadaceae bacterium]|nr:ergothioneine biosynthesis protein EgtB [Gemmatimonadaceae bacterium]